MKRIFVILAVPISLFVLFLIWLNITPGTFDYDDGSEKEACSCNVNYSTSHRQKASCNSGRESHCDFGIPPVLINLSKLDFNK